MKYTLIFEMKLPGYSGIDRTSKEPRTLSCVPSWNDVLSLEQWGQNKLKQSIQHAFLSALRACETGSSTTTTSASSTRSTLAGIAASCLVIHQRQRELKRANAKREKAKQSIPSSKSSPAPTSPKENSAGLGIITFKGAKLLVRRVNGSSFETVRPATLTDVLAYPAF
jgi:hypothetical protein